MESREQLLQRDEVTECLGKRPGGQVLVSLVVISKSIREIAVCSIFSANCGVTTLAQDTEKMCDLFSPVSVCLSLQLQSFPISSPLSSASLLVPTLSASKKLLVSFYFPIQSVHFFLLLFYLPVLQQQSYFSIKSFLFSQQCFFSNFIIYLGKKQK